jgi:ERCC4-type nuclease
MVDVVLSVDIHEPQWLAEGLGVENQVHLTHGDILIERNGETWGIERKTWTDALNSWMKKRLEKQVVEMASMVDHAFLLIQHEPDRKLQGGISNTYERFKRHSPNLKRHLNRLCAEVCPVIYCDDAETAVKEIIRLKERIRDGKFGAVTLYDHNVRHQDPTLQFLMSVPRIGITRAKNIKQQFLSLRDLIDRSDELETMIRNKNDVEHIQQFLQTQWNDE